MIPKFRLWWRRCLRSVGVLRDENAGRAADAEMSDELSSHIELRTEANIKAGMTPAAARGEAMRQFGWMESVKEVCREERGARWLENFFHDLRFGARQLRKNPGFTLVAVLTVAVGVGATASIFSVVKTTLFDPLPVRQSSDRYVQIVAVNKKQGWSAPGINPPAWLEVTRQTNLFSRVAAYEYESLNLDGESFPDTVPGLRVTPSLFRLWTLNPSLGRVFSDEDASAGHDDVVVISHSFWQKRLGGDPNVIGRVLRFHERPLTVIGVMPAYFVFPNTYYEFWRPFAGPVSAPSTGPSTSGGGEWLSNTGVLAEMRDGVMRSEVQAFLDVISQRQAQAAPFPNAEMAIRCHDLNDLFSKPELRRTLWILLGAVAFVLLIASANIANLQVARTERRQSELAVRAALGAGRLRVLRQLITENLLLAFLGGAASLLFTVYGLKLLETLISPELPRLKPVELNFNVVGIAFAVTALSSLLFGLIPARLGIRVRLNEVLKLGAVTSSRDRRGGRFSRGLIVLQIAVASVLLTGAGLMVRSVANLLTVNLGFDPRNIARVYPGIDFNRYFADQDHGPALLDAEFADMHDRLAAIPGVLAVGIGLEGGDFPVSTVTGGAEVKLEEHFVGVDNANPVRAMGVPLLAGRWLEHGDVSDAPTRVMLNQSAAHRLWPEQNAVGQRLWFKKPTGKDSFTDVAYEVVGVVGDARADRYDQTPRPSVFRVASNLSVIGPARYLLIRTAGHPVKFSAAIERELKNAGATASRPAMLNLEESLYAATAGQRTLMAYLVAFSAVGIFLAAIGLYGVLAYSVARRTREIGIRMALGAEARDVLAMVLRQGMQLLFIGLLLGLACGVALGRVLRAFMFDVTTHDAVTLFSAALILSLVALIASFLPARRAAGVEPTEALRTE